VLKPVAMLPMQNAGSAATLMPDPSVVAGGASRLSRNVTCGAVTRKPVANPPVPSRLRTWVAARFAARAGHVSGDAIDGTVDGAFSAAASPSR